MTSLYSRQVLHWSAWIGLLASIASCGNSSVPTPFLAPPELGTGGAGVAVTPAPDAGESGQSEPADLGLGAPCSSSADCDDHQACSDDQCDVSLGRCRFTPNPASCDNGVYCDGAEVCDLRRGCVAGDPVACSDGTTCTVDSCRESDRSCVHLPRDADGDGDPDGNCNTGADCDDLDPLRSSRAAEICSNGRDDDCDGKLDEVECRAPSYDTCSAPLTVTQSGHHRLELGVASGSYSASCVSGAGVRDLVVAALIPEAGADLDVSVEGDGAGLALAAQSVCGDASTELACDSAADLMRGGQAARLRLRSLAAGTIPILIFGTAGQWVDIAVEYLPSSDPPTHETCGLAQPIVYGVPTVASLVGTHEDLPSECASHPGDLVYALTLTEPQDLRVQASSVDGRFAPVLALFSGDCTLKEQERTCRGGENLELFARALPAGTHYLGVSAEGPSDVSFLAELSPATAAPADEDCLSAGPLPANRKLGMSLAGHTDDLRLGCLDGTPDAVYSLELPVTSDVRLVGSLAQGDTARVALLKPDCAESGSVMACEATAQSPLRVAVQGVNAGSYRVAVESEWGASVALSALVRPSAPTLAVSAADRCEDAAELPASGARLEGDTRLATADYSAGCDGDSTGGGAPDQVLRLQLDRRQRVVLDASDSSYSTLLDIRRGPGCPGTEVPEACSAGFGAGNGYLDVLLDPGTYYVQVDGFEGDRGAWVLDAYIVDP